MSSDEEALAVGRIVAEYQQVKRQWVALRSEGERLGKAISAIGTAVQFGHALDRQQYNLAVLDAEKLLAHSKESAATNKRLTELGEQLSALGLAPKADDR
jgi:hypothetical protein